MAHYWKKLSCQKQKKHREVKDLKIHRDQMTDYKNKVDRMKDDIARRNKEIQKERDKKKRK